MEARQAYNLWAAQYDTNRNRTRDLEAVALREMLPGQRFEHCLEIGCGTGKNTKWLASRTANLTAVDLSEEMLAQAKQKITSGSVQFRQHDINKPWPFGCDHDLITFSLVLEHIADLQLIFEKAAACLVPGGYLYVGELHPFKQYTGTRARFETGQGLQEVECFDHHVSAFTGAGWSQGLELLSLNEYFDDDAKQGLPRILALLFRKPLVG